MKNIFFYLVMIYNNELYYLGKFSYENNCYNSIQNMINYYENIIDYDILNLLSEQNRNIYSIIKNAEIKCVQSSVNDEKINNKILHFESNLIPK